MSNEIRWIKGSLHRETSAGSWEPIETTATTDAEIAYRSIQRLLLSITNGEIIKAGLTRSELNPLIEALDTLQAIKTNNDKCLEDELKPNPWTEAANADGYLFDEYNEIAK